MERLAFPIKMFTIYLEQYFLDITRLNNDLAKIKYISLIHFTGLNYAKIAKNDVQWLFFKPFRKFNQSFFDQLNTSLVLELNAKFPNKMK